MGSACEFGFKRMGAGAGEKGEDGCAGGGVRFVGVDGGADGCGVGVGAGGTVSAGVTDAISVRS